MVLFGALRNSSRNRIYPPRLQHYYASRAGLMSLAFMGFQGIGS